MLPQFNVFFRSQHNDDPAGINSFMYGNSVSDSQGGKGNFTYLLEGQIHFALKFFVGHPIKLSECCLV